MRDILVLFIHVVVTLVRLSTPGGLRSVVAESVLVRHQLLILNRGRKRAPNLRVYDRIVAGLCTFLMRPARVLRSSIVLKPSTLLRFHQMLVKGKYRALFSPKRGGRPGPKGPDKELINTVVEMKRRNPRWGCRRIAQQIALAFGVEIDKDVVRRILTAHFRPESGSSGPSWLTFLGHTKDTLWSADLFRLESLTLQTHWVLVVMDQFTRRIVGFGIHRGIVDGAALCRMFREAIRRKSPPKYLSTDNDPLYRFHQWQANLRILEVAEVKAVPGVPLSHPFVERLIGAIRRECLDQTLFWQQRTWRRSSEIFKTTLMDIARIQDWEGSCRNPAGNGGDELCVLPMAEALSRAISDTNCRMIFGIHHTQVRISGSPRYATRLPDPTWTKLCIDR